MMNNGHDKFINYLRTAGAYLVENAEDIVGNSPKLNRIYINICLSWPDDEIPILTVTKNYFVDGEPNSITIRLDKEEKDG